MKETIIILGEYLLATIIVLLFVAIIMIPFVRADLKNQIVQYNAFKQSLKNARLNNTSELENAAILNKIIGWNMKIESAKHWNKTILKVYIPNEFAELEPIK